MRESWASRSTELLPVSSLASVLTAQDQRDLFEVLAESQGLPPAAAGRLRAAYARERAATIQLQAPESFSGAASPTLPLPVSLETDTILESSADARVLADPLSQSVRAGLSQDLETLTELGRGGMGLVLRVRDRRLGRDAALKLIRDAADADSVARFLREARITAGLDHPAIPPVYDAGLDDQRRYFLLMKVIEGETLRDRIRAAHTNGLDPTDRAALLEELLRVAEGLAHAHERGIIHRDLKPDNIMIGDHGEVRLMDWGLARRLDEPQGRVDFIIDGAAAEAGEEALTQAGTVMGTPGYMPPEQAGGPVDARSDVFALGAVLTEVLTGQAAVPGRTGMERLHATLKGRVRSPSQLARGVPAELDSLARAALELDPERRLPSAEDFVHNLRCFLRGAPLPVHAYTAGQRLHRWLTRHPWTLAAAASALIIAALSVGLAQSIRARRRSERAVALQFKAQEALRQGLQRAQVDRAIDEFLELGDRAYPFLLSAARLREDEGRAAEAEALLREAADTGERPLEALFALHFIELARSPLSLKQTSPAMRRLLAESEAAGSEGGYALYARAVALHREAERRAGSEKRELLRRAIALYDAFEQEVSAANPFLYLDRATARVELGEFQGAIADCDRAEARSLTNVRLSHVRAYARSRLGDKAGALADYNHIITATPEAAIAESAEARGRYAQVHLNRGVLRSQKGDPRGALADYERALELKPGYEKAILGRAKALRQLGREDEATAAMDRLAEGSRSAKTFHNRGHLRAERGEHAAAIEDFSEAVALDPGYAKAWAKRGRSRAALNRDDPRALTDLERAIALGGFPFAYLYRAELHRARGDGAAAAADLKRFLGLVTRGPRADQARAMLRSLSAGR